MIVVDVFPKNKDKFIRLVEFLRQVLDMCEDLKIHPVLNASFAVFAYTKDEDMNVDDVDLLIPENRFYNIAERLASRGIESQIKEWHVLRIQKDDLKIEFDSIEYWSDEWGLKLPHSFERVDVKGLTVDILDLPNLIRTYRIGAEKSSARGADYKRKYEALKRVPTLK